MKGIIRAFKALSDPTRLRIFLLLMKKNLCVCELMFILNMPQSRISHQLRILRDADLVEDKRDGRWITYSIPQRSLVGLETLFKRVLRISVEDSPEIGEDLKNLSTCLKLGVRRTGPLDNKVKEVPKTKEALSPRP